MTNVYTENNQLYSDHASGSEGSGGEGLITLDAENVGLPVYKEDDLFSEIIRFVTTNKLIIILVIAVVVAVCIAYALGKRSKVDTREVELNRANMMMRVLIAKVKGLENENMQLRDGIMINDDHPAHHEVNDELEDPNDIPVPEMNT